MLDVKSLRLPEVKVIKYGRFRDYRGYFTETFQSSDIIRDCPEISIERGMNGFSQVNESVSKAGTFRGFHFQHSPFMGKLVRPVTGKLIDFAMDIRKNSVNFGKIIAYEISANPDADFGEWIWIPVGFAHGMLLPEDSIIEYFCSGTYNPNAEICISPFDPEIDWSFCESNLKKQFDKIVPTTSLISEKDKNGIRLQNWKNHQSFELFKV